MSCLSQLYNYGRDILENSTTNHSGPKKLIVFIREGYEPRYALVDEPRKYYDAEKINRLYLLDSEPLGHSLHQHYDYFAGSNRFFERLDI